MFNKNIVEHKFVPNVGLAVPLNNLNAIDALARIKVTWNRYLFEIVLPKAWVEFLRELLLKVTNIKSNDLYKFWPIFKEEPSSASTIGKISEVLVESYNLSSSEFYWLSPSNGYLEDGKHFNFTQRLLDSLSPAVIRTYLGCNRARWENTMPRKEVLELFNLYIER
ncbi:hypothetical protein C1645_823675 [Glomus cerebriforme]|uniref:Uncharacterized protein n=1 Tax=Glomus cerebriforme TaxID=658196 RepID=A0A397SVX4_9GLOM|nr:hypothetical protein C1645_823675 [Glomus cerebriforme]